MVCQFLTGSWGRNFVDWVGGVKGKITPGMLSLFEKSYLSIQQIATQVYMKSSTIKPLHDKWVIKIHNLVSQRPELNKSGFRKVGLLSYY